MFVIHILSMQRQRIDIFIQHYQSPYMTVCVSIGDSVTYLSYSVHSVLALLQHAWGPMELRKHNLCTSMSLWE